MKQRCRKGFNRRCAGFKEARAHLLYSQARVSPDGRYVGYVTNDIGKYRVFLYDFEKGKRKKILKSGYRSYLQETDVLFPRAGVASKRPGDGHDPRAERKTVVGLLHACDKKNGSTTGCSISKRSLTFRIRPTGNTC
jgi:hypothetical protein